LGKFKKGALKAGPTSNYMVLYHLNDAKINLALGLVTGFESSLNNALTTSLTAYGETSTSYATNLLDVADIYLDYGNFRLSREHIEKSEAILKKTDQLNDALKGRIALLKAEAMIGQGFANAAIDLLREYEKYFAARAVEKETIVEGTSIKTKRIPEDELFQRFNDYAQLKALIGNALAKKGRISIIGADSENPDVDAAFLELDSWLKGKRRFLGETSLVKTTPPARTEADA
jgi:tetratricopeptide (TPR) repeat protein